MAVDSSLFSQPVSDFMVAPVHTVNEGDRLTKAQERIDAFGISALPVLNDHGVTVGIISRADLLRAGRVRVHNGFRKKVLTFPDARVREFMHATVEVIDPRTPLHQAANRLMRQHIHALFVADDGRILGVLGTREVTGVVAHAKITVPIQEIMSRGVVVVQAADPLSLAVDRMAASHRHGLVVVEEGWPVGMFTQVQALQARDAPPDQPVDEWMDHAILPLPLRTPAYRAAQQSSATRANAVLAVDADGVAGIVTGTDFAKLAK